MNEKERIQIMKERTMSGLNLQNEIHSPHEDEETFDIEGLFEDLQNWSSVSVEVGSENNNTPEVHKEMIDIQRVSKDFQELIDQYRPAVQLALNEVANSTKFLKANQSWTELRSWDQTFRCTNEGCGDLVSVDDLANHKGQFTFLAKHLIPEVRGRLSEELLKLYNEDRKLHFWSMAKTKPQKEGVEAKINLRRYEVDWKGFRTFVMAVLESGEGRKVEMSVHGTKHTATVKDRINAKNTGPLNRQELRTLSRSNTLLVQFALRLKTIERKMLHCRGCQQVYWDNKTWPSEREYFHRISGKIIRSVLETAVGNAVIRAPKSIQVVDAAGELHRVSFGSGNEEGKAARYRKQMLGEAVLTAFQDNTSFEIAAEDNKLPPYMAQRDDQKEVELFIALGTEVAERLARELKSVKPHVAFLVDNAVLAQSGKEPMDRDDWCKTRAVQLLYAVHTSKSGLFKIEKTRAFRYTNGDTPDHSSNLIRLTNKVHKDIRERFVLNDGDEQRNLLKELYHRERMQPMLCPPLDRSSEDFTLGGYCTPEIQSQHPLVSDKQGTLNAGFPRFQPSEEATAVLNVLQKTKWTVDSATYRVVKEILEHEINHNIIGKLSIQADGDGVLIDYSDGLSSIRNGQVREWRDTFRFIDDLFTNHPGDPTFWHPWFFDWRGRMYTSTTMLSPQNDDLCRGLLRFGQKTALTESGFSWMRRRCASFFRDVEGVGTLSKGTDYLKLIAKLDDKSWLSYDEVGQDPLFEEMLEEILALPIIEGYNIWGKGDVFRAKAEGFQRYSLMHEYMRVVKAGGVGVETNMPLNVDASSSVYQHAAALLRDLRMAQSVNVATKEGQLGPADVYLEVIAELTSRWEESCPLDEEKYGLDEELKSALKKTLLSRKVAKKPVMTHGYGAGHVSITRSFLTHNQDPDGDVGGWVEVDKKREDGKMSYQAVAHPESTLKLLYNRVDNELHYPLASAVVSDYIEAIKAVLPSFNEVTTWLRKMVNKHEDGFGQPLQWTLRDGSNVLNQYWHDAKTESVSPWTGLQGHREQLRSLLGPEHEALVPTSFGEVIDFAGIEAHLNSFEKDLTEELAFVEYVKESEGSRLAALSEALDDGLKSFVVEDVGVNWEHLRADKNLTANKGPLSPDEIRGDDALKPFASFITPNDGGQISVRRKSGQRSIESERTGIAPNLVHSLDALHMRMVLQGFANSLKITDFWSVHDSFGCHPNHIEELTVNVRGKFVQLHEMNNPDGGLFFNLLKTIYGEELYKAGPAKKAPKPGELRGKDIDSDYMVN